MCVLIVINVIIHVKLPIDIDMTIYPISDGVRLLVILFGDIVRLLISLLVW